MSQLAQSSMSGAIGRSSADAFAAVARLTPRRREVLALTAAGLTNRQIGERLGIRWRTAQTLMRHVYKHKDPRGWGEFAKMLGEHSGIGSALTMLHVQLERPTLWELEADLKKLQVPLLIIVGDEDESCLDGSLFMKRRAPQAALCVIPRAGHTITSEEPAAVNAALAELFAAAEAGRWMSHKGA